MNLNSDLSAGTGNVPGCAGIQHIKRSVLCVGLCLGVGETSKGKGLQPLYLFG